MPEIPGLMEELTRRGFKVESPEDGSIPSTRAMERELKQKQIRGQLAVQDAINELNRRGVQTKLETEPAEREISVGQSKEALENFQKGGDPGAFKDAWRKFFPGMPLPRKDGKIDYQGGADDIEIEIDRIKRLEASKQGAQNITESKIKRINPKSKLEEEVLVRTDKASGKVLGETVLSSQPPNLSEVESKAKRFSARMNTNQERLVELESKGFDPSALSTTIQKWLPNRFQSAEVQDYESTKENWIAATLRDESGAAIAKKEYKDAGRQYFAQDGDSPIVVKRKQKLRDFAEKEMTETVGPSAPDRKRDWKSLITAFDAGEAPAKMVTVRNRAEADALGSDVQFFQTPDGRTLKNPKFKTAQ